MDLMILLLTCFFFVHIFFLIKTRQSSFYWFSKILLVLEAVQIGGLRSLPIWYDTWKKMYSIEANVLKKQISEAK